MHKLNVLKNPAGTFHFVGTVPVELALEGNAADVAAVVHCGFVGDLKTKVCIRTWTTRKGALDAANLLGYTVA